MATFGKIHEYDPLLHDWNDYIEQLEQFFIANGIEDATKK